MSQTHAERRPPEVLDFEGSGEEARGWLDTAYGTTLRLTGPIGRVSHHRLDHGSVAFDRVKIDTGFAFDADPMPTLVVVDLLSGTSEYTRDHVTDRLRAGESVLTSGWGMPYTGRSDGFEIRATAFTAEAVSAAVAEVAPDYPWQRITFSSYVPRSAPAGALWRATVSQLSAACPGEEAPLARGEALRLLGHTLLQTFPNNVVGSGSSIELDRDSRDATPSTVRRAVGIVEARVTDDLSLAELAQECRVTPRALQYAFRRHLGCTPMAYLRRVRLDLARQVLTSGESPSVAEVAARFGFFNPGRFASEYRQVFRENPGQTLQRSSL